MRTTVGMDDDLHAMLKARAEAEGRSMNSLVDTALRHYLATTASAGHLEVFDDSITKRDGVFPGAALDDSAALFDLMSTR